MKRKLTVLFVVVFIALLTVTSASAAGGTQGRGPAGVIYVTSQGLYYDTYTVVDPLPFKGPFQKLENGMTCWRSEQSMSEETGDGSWEFRILAWIGRDCRAVCDRFNRSTSAEE